MSAHTPGPWHATTMADGQTYVFRADGKCLTQFSGSLTKPDARLIAAAPELLQALREIVRIDDNVRPGDYNNALIQICGIARDAIATATGEQE